jgi:large subunit ribosomal protein L30
MAEKQTKTGGTAGKGTIRLRWRRSAIAAPTKHKLVIKGLGFTRLNQVIERKDTPSIRGMVKKVPHLVEIVDKEAV